MEPIDVGSINFQGLASGINTGDIVAALVKVARIPIAQIEAQSQRESARANVYNSVVTALQNLQNTAMGIDRLEELEQAQATSSNPNVITASATTEADYSTHSVLVQALATTQRTYSSSFTSANTAGLLHNGTLSLRNSLGTQNITIDNTTTLQSLQTSIATGPLGLTAAIVDEGSTYRLYVESATTGQAQQFSITDSGSNTGLTADGVTLTGNTVQLAQNAQLQLDNISTISRSSNSINDLITGLTFNLQNTSGTAQTIQVEPSPTGMSSAIGSFVTAYNSAVSLISAILTPPDSAQPATPSFGSNPNNTPPWGANNTNTSSSPVEPMVHIPSDTNLNNILLSLQNIITTPVSGADANVVALSMIGITTAEDGTLVIDENTLNEQINASPNSVAKLFVKTYSSGNGVAEQIADYMFSVTSVAGPLYSAINSMQSDINRMSDVITLKEQNLRLYEETLKRRFTDLERRMSKLKAQSQQLLAMLPKND